MQNGYYENTSGNIPSSVGVIPQLTISAKRNCSVSVTNPSFPNWSLNFNVEANGIQQQNLPKEYCYHMGSDNETRSNKGIHIVSTDTISVYCANIANYSFDASFVLPVEGLGDDYIIQCGEQSQLTNVNYQYQLDNQTSAFLIVATEDNTTLHITPSVTTLGGHEAGITFDVTLNAGQTYHVRSNNNTNNRDLSGSRVQADDCKKIAVFNGNTLTRIPVQYTSGNTGFDHIFEQVMPVRSWGKKFVVTQSMTRSRDWVKVISAVDGNVIRKNGQVIANLNANETYSFALTSYEGSCYLEASHICAVYLYNTSANDGKANGDPSMVWIAPIEQKIDEVTFATFSHSQATIDYHHVNIIVKAEDAGSVYLDGNLLSPLEFSTVNGNSEYKFTRKDLSHRTHHLYCANGFNAHVYGFGEAKGYAYLVGSNAIDLSTSLVVNEMNIGADEIYTYCAEEPITFSAEVNLEDYQLLWDFGDGENSSANPTTHIFHDNLIYHVSLKVTTNGSGCEASSSVTTYFDIDTRQQYVTENDEACEGQYYSGFGFSNVLIHNDTILGRPNPNQTHPECNDSLLVYIHALPSIHTPLSASRCWTGEPGIYDENGFTIEYTEPRTYYDTIYGHTSDGCDDITTIELIVGEFQLPDPPIDVAHECYNPGETPYFVWERNGEEFHGDTIKEITLPDPNGGCDFKYTLDLQFHESFHLEEEEEQVCDHYVWWATGDTITEEGPHSLFQNFHGGGGSLFNCDSIYTKTITITGKAINDTLPTITDQCNSYAFAPWPESDTVVFTSDTTYTFEGESEGCPWNRTVIIEGMGYTPAPKMRCATPGAVVYGPNNDTVAVVTNTEFFSFQYDFYVEDTLGHIASWEQPEWNISKTSWSIQPFTNPEEPDKYYCRVYVAEHYDDYVFLTVNMSSPCGSDSCRFVLKSSFLDIAEQHTAKPDLTVVPNPNNGNMKLHFENLTGKTSIKVYDMRGIPIDSFEIYNELNSNTLHYTLNNISSGIYCFVATAKEGTIAKKVIIE